MLTATATNAAAFGSDKYFGSLAPQGKWKVGTVDAGGSTPYCAMVNKFDKNLVLAFSRDADGRGSVAVDFHKGFFKPGTDYDVDLRTGDAKPRRFSGRASSERSVVVQLGQDEAFYADLNKAGNLKMALSGIEATFVLRKFSGSYTSLLNCAGGLHQGPKTTAVPVPGVERSSLPSQQLQFSLRQAVEDRNKEIAQMKDTQQQKDTAHAEEISKHERELALRVATLQKYSELAAAMSNIPEKTLPAKETQPAEPSKQQVQKPAEIEGLAAQELQTRLLQAALSAKEQELLSSKTARIGDNKRLMEVQAELRSMTIDRASVVDQMQVQLNEKGAQYEALEKEVEAHNKSLPVTFKTAAELAAKKEDVVRLEKKLAAVLAESEPLLSDREKAESQLVTVQSRISALEGQLLSTGEQKKELATRLEAQGKQTRELQDALDAKERELAEAKAATPEIAVITTPVTPAIVPPTDKAAAVQSMQARHVHLEKRAAENITLGHADAFLNRIMLSHRPAGGRKADAITGPAPLKLHIPPSSAADDPSDLAAYEPETVVIQ